MTFSKINVTIFLTLQKVFSNFTQLVKATNANRNGHFVYNLPQL